MSHRSKSAWRLLVHVSFLILFPRADIAAVNHRAELNAERRCLCMAPKKKKIILLQTYLPRLDLTEKGILDTDRGQWVFEIDAL